MANAEEDDYMNMTFDGPEFQKQPEMALQRAARLKKEAAERGRPISKAERVEREKAARDEALATALPSTNKGAKMLARMGFVPGSALGKSDSARVTPIEVFVKGDRGGIGVDAEKKRKIREVADEALAGKKRQKMDADGFRERNAREKEEKRMEGMMWSAMRTLEEFETTGGKGGEENVSEGQQADDSGNAKSNDRKPLREINVLYRSLVAQRRDRERERGLHKYDFDSLISNRAKHNKDLDSDDDDKIAVASQIEDPDPDFDEPDEDSELAKFHALRAADRLEKIVMELRDRYHYCFWCKFRYPDAVMNGCPGITEDEHG